MIEGKVVSSNAEHDNKSSFNTPLHIPNEVARGLAGVLIDSPDIGKALIQYKAKSGTRSYEAFTASAVLSILRPILGKHGLGLVFNTGDQFVGERYLGRYGGSQEKQPTVFVPCYFTLIAAENGDTWTTTVNQPVPESLGTVVANDNALYTFAVKTFVRVTFMVSDFSANEEQELADGGDQVGAPVNNASKSQRIAVQELMVALTTIVKGAGDGNYTASGATSGGDEHTFPLSRGAITSVERLLGKEQGLFSSRLVNEGDFLDFPDPLHLNVEKLGDNYRISRSQDKGLTNPAVYASLRQLSGLNPDEIKRILHISELTDYKGNIQEALVAIRATPAPEPTLEDIAEGMGGVPAPAQ